MRYALTFRKNLSDLDRLIRFIIGVVLLMLVYDRVLKGQTGLFATIIGISKIADSIMGYCIFYDLMGWSTRKTEEELVEVDEVI